MSMYIRNAIRVSIPLGLLMLSSLALSFALSACGAGAYEQCLANSDCPPNQQCERGQCKAPTVQERPSPAEKTTPKEPVAPKEKTLPKEAPGKQEPITKPDASVPEEPHKEPEPQCREDKDCPPAHQCKAGICEKTPAATACAPVQFIQELSHPHDPGTAPLKIAYRPDHKAYAVFAKQLLRIHEDKTGKVLQTIFSNITAVSKIIWAPDGNTIATPISSNLQRIQLWDLNTQKLTHEIPAKAGIFSSDSKTLITIDALNITHWNIKTGTKTKQLPIKLPNNMTPEFFPGGKRILLTSVLESVEIWDTETGKKIKDFTVGPTNSYNSFLSILNQDLFAIQIGAPKQTVKAAIFSATQAKEIASIPGNIWSLALHPNGHDLLYISTQGLRQLDLRDPKSNKSTGIAPTSTQSFTNLLFHPTGANIIIHIREQNGPKNTLRFYNTQTYALERSVLHPGNSKAQLFFKDDSSTLLSTSGDGLFKYWTLEDNPTTISRLLNVAFHTTKEPAVDGSSVLQPGPKWNTSLSIEKAQVAVWDAQAHTFLRLLDIPKTYPLNIRTFDYLNEGKQVVGLLGGEELIQWDLSTGKQLKTQQVKRGTPTATLLGVNQQTGLIGTLSVDGNNAHVIDVWDAKGLTKKYTFTYPYYTWHAAMSPKGAWMAVIDRSKHLHVIDLNTGKVKHTFTVPFGNGRVHFSPSARYVAFTVANKAIIFDINDGKQIEEFSGSVNLLAFSPDDTHIAIAESGGNVLLRDFHKHTLISTLINKRSPSTVDQLLFSPNGKHLAFSSNYFGQIQLWSCPK